MPVLVLIAWLSAVVRIQTGREGAGESAYKIGFVVAKLKLHLECGDCSVLTEEGY